MSHKQHLTQHLTMVSLGPGDPELITLKALKALKNAQAIGVPTKSSDGSFARSLTYKIVRELMEREGFERAIFPVYTPMRFREEDWQAQVETLYGALEEHGDVCFVTLGDSGIYSTVYYLLDRIAEQRPEVYDACEVIPGVTSFSQASALAKRPLCVGESQLRIMPLLEKEVPTTTVYMRPKIGMDTEAIPHEGAMMTFEDLGFAGEAIHEEKVPVVRRYMTLLIDFFTKDPHAV